MRKLCGAILGILCFLCLGGSRVEAQEKAPYMSRDYLEEYIKENNIEVYSFKESNKVQKYVENCSEDPVFIEKIKKVGRNPYYGITKNNPEFLYIGQVKKNKPDGIGAILKPVEVIIDSENEEKAYVTEYEGYTEEVYYVRTYIGEFKDGRPEGYGIEFSVPGDSDYIMQPVDMKIYKGEKIQEGIFESANPRKYEGKFKNGQYSGKGNEFVYMGTYWEGGEGINIEDYSEYLGENEKKNDKIEDYLTGANQDIIIYSGTYKKGKRKGTFKVYEWGFLSYEGDMKGDLQSGKGKIYYPLSEQVQYDGELVGGEYDGKGTLYNEDGSVQYKGKWEMGDYEN